MTRVERQNRRLRFVQEVRCRVNLKIVVRDAVTGKVRRVQRIHNLVTTAGLNLIRDLLNGTATPLSHFAVGTSNTAVSLGQTALVAEVFRDVITSTTATSGQLAVLFYLGSLSANGVTLKEAGLFTASVGGTMYARALISPTIAKDASTTVTFEWDLTWS